LSADVVVGHAAHDAESFRGWFVGQFIPADLGLRSTDAVEVKWGTHASGESRPAWSASAEATSLSLLIQGCIRLLFADGSQALLTDPGDYAIWPPGLAHRWQIEADDTVVLTIRWPSRPNDATEVPR
jgi:quercetin dioxygenase-like cupin family protein